MIVGGRCLYRRTPGNHRRMVERTFGQCARSFYVGEGVTEADVKAKYENGILELSVPKKEPQKVDSKKYIAIEG